MDEYKRYLRPDILSYIENLEIKARLIIEGIISGLHKSPHHGFSVEFAEHREYVPGDDIKHLDWKVFAKSDRFFVKEYEEETNLKVHIILDMSESMRYGTSGLSKWDYACLLTATLVYLFLKQQDSVGLVLFDTEIRCLLPPQNRPSYIKDILTELTDITPRQKTSVSDIFNKLAEAFQKRGMVVIISDFFVKLDDLFQGLRHFRFNRHEVLLFQILDQDELTFPFKAPTLFKGMEGYPQILVDPKTLRQAYLSTLRNSLDRIKKQASQDGIEYMLLSTSDSLGTALTRFLATRSGLLGKRIF